MLLIPCPHCGERDENEFDYGGRAIDFPDLTADSANWHEALHLPVANNNIVEEVWFHTAGCECWIRLRRDIRNHDFHANNGDD